MRGLAKPVRVLLLVVVALQLVTLAVAARELVLAMSANADLASPLTMGRDAADYPGSVLVTGNYAWWNGLWATQLLNALPGAVTTTNYVPLVLTVLAALALAAGAARLFGAVAGLTAAVLTLAIGTGPLLAGAAWSSRAPAWWAAVALGLVAVWAATRPAGRARLAWDVVAGLVAVWTAAALAGDALAWSFTLAPLAITAVVAAASRAWRVAGVLAALAVVVVGLRFAIRAAALAAGYDSFPAATELVPVDGLGAGAANAFLALQTLWRTDAAGVLPAVAAYLATAVALGVAVAAVPALRRTGAADLPRRVWTAFWAAVLVLPIGAFVISANGGPIGAPVARYLFTTPFAVAGLLAPVVAAGGARALLTTAAVAAIGVVNAVGLLGTRPPESADLHRQAIGGVRDAVARYDLDRGYASYWTAAPMEHATAYALDVVPVGRCADVTGGEYRLCRPPLHTISGEYREQPGTRTFLLVDRRLAAAQGNPQTYVTQPPAGVRPERVVALGGGLELHVYPFDLAREIR